MKKKDLFESGTKRVKSKDLKLYTKKGKDWRKEDNMPESTHIAINLYHSKKKLDILIDRKADEFLKGHLNPNMQVSGSRIKTLPNGKTLARAGFSLFAKNLQFNHDKTKNWAVCYENASGLKTYLYDENNLHLEQAKKSKLVDKFALYYPLILSKLEKDLKEKKSVNYLTLWTLLKTHARIGNLEYYHHLGHKGLTTLQKKDLTIKGDKVRFVYIGKDGVPQDKEIKFEDFYIKLLQSLLKKKKASDFVFTDSHNIPLHSSDMSKILFNYTGVHFYPHIIRSHYADTEAKKFLKRHRKATKEQILDKFKEIALNLGHKKFNKKSGEWEIDYKITITNYIRPEYVEKMKKMYER